jgi:hypothetical protein
MTATVFPGVAFVVFFLLNLALWGDKATGAVPFGTLVALLLIWFTISVPLVFVGSFVGFRAAAWEHPVRINSIPRQIPDQIWYVYVCLELTHVHHYVQAALARVLCCAGTCTRHSAVYCTTIYIARLLYHYLHVPP